MAHTNSDRFKNKIHNMIEGMVGKYGTLVNQRKTSKTSLIYLLLSTCNLWSTKSVQSSTEKRNALGESQAISLNAKTSNMLHKKQENILETQSIRKTAPTNHASLDRFKKKISQSGMLDVADKEYSRRANKMQTWRHLLSICFFVSMHSVVYKECTCVHQKA